MCHRPAFFTIDCCISEGETLRNKQSILNNLLAVILVIRKLHRMLHVVSSGSLGDGRQTFCEPQQRADFPQMVWMTSLYPICHIDWIRIGIVKRGGCRGGAKVTLGLSLPPGWRADQLFFWCVIAPVECLLRSKRLHKKVVKYDLGQIANQLCSDRIIRRHASCCHIEKQ